jgi:hypothetical protein
VLRLEEGEIRPQSDRGTLKDLGSESSFITEVAASPVPKLRGPNPKAKIQWICNGESADLGRENSSRVI